MQRKVRAYLGANVSILTDQRNKVKKPMMLDQFARRMLRRPDLLFGYLPGESGCGCMTGAAWPRHARAGQLRPGLRPRVSDRERQPRQLWMSGRDVVFHRDLAGGGLAADYRPRRRRGRGSRLRPRRIGRDRQRHARPSWYALRSRRESGRQCGRRFGRT
jgi:hypothetical protein